MGIQKPLDHISEIDDHQPKIHLYRAYSAVPRALWGLSSVRERFMRTVIILLAALLLRCVLVAPPCIAEDTYIEPWVMEDGIFLGGEAGQAYYDGWMDEAAQTARDSTGILLSCLPLASEEEKAEIYYFVGSNHLVLGDLDEAEKWFRKGTEIDFIAPEAYGALFKIVELRAPPPPEGAPPPSPRLKPSGFPRVPEYVEKLIEAKKPIYEAARRVCPYNKDLLFPPLGGFLNPRSESAEASWKATGEEPRWLAEEEPIHFGIGVASVFVDMHMWDEAIRCYQLQRYTFELKFKSTKKLFDLPYATKTYGAIGDCYLAKRDFRNAIIWYRMCLWSGSIKKIAYINAYLKGERLPLSLSPLIEQSRSVVFAPEYTEAGADLPPMHRDWFTDSGIGEQDLSLPPDPRQPDAARIERAADDCVRSYMHLEAIRMYRLAEELCGVSLKGKIAQAYEKYADMLRHFRATRDKYATLMGQNITYAVVAATYMDAQAAYQEAGDDEAAARMAEKAARAVDLDAKYGG
jgi:tetratricopeptide (TPR) repeat protein